ncbi:DUF6682 family protein [Allomesorhizobium alhagi]|uniref:Uncharacterized protein n=1 Tax=Mesorhizobium alhagi CCNWXJ12-2 TaxID=1107882 RepID=H0HNI4_9HYPH|nr:DUF6682 family protein [Mesorhizobium alhagi]EHK57637.1 hypothetical protein MAXJ12_08534 [Mesorhizobium alhagi CCNWXJ12-2]
MPTGQEIMERAAVLLNDEDHIRWPLNELRDWINDGIKAIVLAKPSASTSSRILTLAVGTLQSVPATGTPTPLMLVRIVRNLKSQNDPREGGRIVTPTSRETLDAVDPFWHDRGQTPYRKEVRQYVYDEANPLEFYCYPGNDGNGIVEAVVSQLPAPLAASGDETVIGSYTGSIGLPEPYSVPLLDYVMFRALGKDDLGGNPGRAQGHYQLFASAVGLKIQVERATSPNARGS